MKEKKNQNIHYIVKTQSLKTEKDKWRKKKCNNHWNRWLFMMTQRMEQEYYSLIGDIFVVPIATQQQSKNAAKL